MSASLVDRFRDYSAWRSAISQRIVGFRRWLHDNDLADAQTDLRLGHLLERLGEDKLTIAFVAEFSRGKSELINAIFFADYGCRLLPSATGRTTMCPTELQWDPELGPCLRLLPIETRASNASSLELKRYPEEWRVLPLDIDDGPALVEAFSQVRDVKRVPVEEAKHYGLFVDAGDVAPGVISADGMVEIPRWRHAVINFPHPLLAQGLVILDTPGLNAIGTEPELTLNLLPNAHAVLFVLAVDSGVTQTDADVWRDFIAASGSHSRGRFVVLNKIDSLWDGLRSESEINEEIARQMRFAARTLGADDDRILAVSAQKGLVAKITQDWTLLDRSRLPTLEAALSTQLIPGKQEIVRETTRAELLELLGNTRAILEARLTGVLDQISELRHLRGKNLDVVEQMMRKVRVEKDDFERGLVRFQALRGVFSQHTNQLFTHLGMDALNEEAKRTLADFRKARFTPQLKQAFRGYFDGVRVRLDRAGETVAEVQRMMEAMYRKFSEEHGLRLASPAAFSLFKYRKELERLEHTFRLSFDTTYVMVTNEEMSLKQKFFETFASEVRRVFGYANRESDTWLKAVMAPMETQVREHQMQLRRRLESIRRIHRATDTLEDRVQELEQVENVLVQQLERVHVTIEDVERVLDTEEGRYAAAA
jgi:hypothetical protein